MRKRTILALIVMLICIIATNKYWLIFRPMQIGFNIQGREQVSVEVLLNKEDNELFNKVRSADTTINLDENNIIDLSVYRARTPKRLKIVFDSPFAVGGANPYPERHTA